MKVAAVLAAILFCRPQLPLPVAQGYAKAIAGQSVADPLLLVSVVDRETGGTWDAAVVNKKSGAVGLGQVLPQFRPQCAGAPSSAACSLEKKRLLDGQYNLGVVFEIVGALRTFCEKKT
jgi:hypothetical protein